MGAVEWADPPGRAAPAAGPIEGLVPGLLRRARLDGVHQYRVGAVIERGRRVLLLRRAANDSLPGVYELPGGGVEPGEGILEALAREVAEETGLRVISVTAFAGSFDYLARRSGRTARQFNFTCLARPRAVRLHPDEHDRLLWATREAAAAVDVTPGVRAVLERYWADVTPTRSCPEASG
jgi:8-oxo-dGTP diphosphatase